MNTVICKGISAIHSSVIDVDPLQRLIDAGLRLVIEIERTGPVAALMNNSGDSISVSFRVSTQRNRLQVVWHACNRMDSMIRRDGKGGDIEREVDKLLAAIEELRAEVEATS